VITHGPLHSRNGNGIALLHERPDRALGFARPPVHDCVDLDAPTVRERQHLRHEADPCPETGDARYRMVVGPSPEMAKVVTIARSAAASRSTVLLLGESGTGKEVFARAIHQWSERQLKPFVAVNCVGLSRELLESELFGHEKGAFTGAHRLKRGKLELAHGGTAFLDEIGDMSPELQAKLLRFLQERHIERVGGTSAMPIDVRIVAATNRDLEQAVRHGEFREDLYYRLHVIPITLPPLRERREDIAALSEFLVRRFSLETQKPFTHITPEAEARLITHDWPGNVRQLSNVIERAIVLGQPPMITEQDLLLGRPGQGGIMSARSSYKAALDAHRREVIVRALTAAGGNRAAAARALGLHRVHLMRLIRALGIE
jgi:transcriptional regulator with PAS, ATPase and Fis domain